jgi:hypothetical protein
LERAADEAADRVMAKWRVDIFRKRLLNLGTVSAPNAQEALTKAINQFRIERALKEKVIITKLKQPKTETRRKSR